MASILRHSRIGLIAFRTNITIKITTISNATIIYGNMITIIKNTEIERNPTKVHKLKIGGKTRSNVVISFENLVNILPIGFESKKRIFDLMILSTMALCMLVVLVSISTRMMKERKKEPII